MYTIRMPFDLAHQIQEKARERGEKPVQTIRGLLHLALLKDDLRAEMDKSKSEIIAAFNIQFNEGKSNETQ